MSTYETIKSLISAIKAETAKGVNTAAKVGGALMDILDFTKGITDNISSRLNGSALKVIEDSTAADVAKALKSVTSFGALGSKTTSGIKYLQIPVNHVDGTVTYLLVPMSKMTPKFQTGLALFADEQGQLIYIPKVTESQSGYLDSADFKSFKTKITSLTADVYTLKNHDTATTTSISTLSTVYDALQRRITAAETKITTLQGENTALKNRVTVLENHDTSVTSRVTTLENHDTAVTGRVTTLENHDTAVTGRVTTLENHDTALTTRVKKLEDDGAVLN